MAHGVGRKCRNLDALGGQLLVLERKASNLCCTDRLQTAQHFTASLPQWHGACAHHRHSIRLARTMGAGMRPTVKSAGWENRIAQLSLIHSCQCMGPCVVSALKSGTTLPRRSTCASQSL